METRVQRTCGRETKQLRARARSITWSDEGARTAIQSSVELRGSTFSPRELQKPSDSSRKYQETGKYTGVSTWVVKELDISPLKRMVTMSTARHISTTSCSRRMIPSEAWGLRLSRHQAGTDVFGIENRGMDTDMYHEGHNCLNRRSWEFEVSNA
ncbi:hypothetical protein WG66_009728 [Moniliophthora roreri]|nr:hypothetical protein WG66_009728 [Moniliophthora roreri]